MVSFYCLGQGFLGVSFELKRFAFCGECSASGMLTECGCLRKSLNGPGSITNISVHQKASYEGNVFTLNIIKNSGMGGGCFYDHDGCVIPCAHPLCDLGCKLTSCPLV